LKIQEKNVLQPSAFGKPSARQAETSSSGKPSARQAETLGKEERGKGVGSRE